MQRDEINILWNRYREGNATPEDLALLEEWYLNFEDPDIEELNENEIAKRIAQVRSNLPVVKYGAIQISLWRRFAAIAAVVIVAAGGIYFYASYYIKANDQEVTSTSAAILPGTNKATLTLADGKTINLSGDKTGIKIKESELTYDDGSHIPSDGLDQVKVQILVAATPKGGTYRFMLPDGTAVWLNAATTLTFPSSFKNLSDGQSRSIELTGEAYFEVAKDKSHPFIVKTKLQVVKVLGTHFNINSYPDDIDSKTTLLEGSVRVSSLSKKDEVKLKPNEQSIVTERGIRIKTVDPDDVISWKTGDFNFSDEPLTGIMKDIARWYNVDVVYTDKAIAAKPFSGYISRYGKITEVLRLLEATGEVKFKINGRTLTVTNK